MLRLVALLLFALVLIALFSSLVSLLREPSGSRRTANRLMLRVALSAALLLLLLLGFLSGQLHSHAPW